MPLALLALLACTPDSAPGVTTDPPTPSDPAETGMPDTTSETEPRALLAFETVPTNLIVVSLDTTRRDRIGRFASDGTSPTPNLDAWLAESVTFDNHRSCSNWTGASMACVVTGALPMEQGWWPWNFAWEGIVGARADLPTLAVMLRDQRGFDTSLVTANAVFGRGTGLGLARGFSAVDERHDRRARGVADRALAEAQRLVGQETPFYLHTHFMDPHASYCPPEDYVGEGYVGIEGLDLCDDFYSIVDGGTLEDWPAEQQQAFISTPWVPSTTP